MWHTCPENSLPIGEVVPAREGLRPLTIAIKETFVVIGEVVPAREGLRQVLPKIVLNFDKSEKWFQQEKD